MKLKQALLYALVFFLLAAASIASFNLTSELIGNSDSIGYFYPTKQFAAGNNLWNPYIGCGYPAFADPQSQMFYPLNLIYYILPDVLNYNIFILLHIALIGFFMFFYLRNCRISDKAAFIGGCIFMLGGIASVSIYSPAIICSLAWAPLVLLLIEKYWQTGRKYWLPLISTGTFLFITAGHPQITMCFMTIVVLYILFAGAARSQKKIPLQRNIHMGAIFTFILLGLGLSAISLLPALKLSVSTVASDLIFAQRSCDIYNLILMVFPRFLSSSAISENFCNGYYIGIFGLSFAIIAAMAFRKKKNKLVLFWTFIAFFGLLLSVIKYNLLYKALYFMPGLAGFQSSGHHILEWSLGAAFLAATTAHYMLVNNENTFTVSKMSRSFGRFWLMAAAGSMMLFYVIRQYLSDVSPGINESGILDNIRVSSLSCTLAFIVIIGTGLLLLILPGWRLSKYFTPLVIAFVIMELFASGYAHETTPVGTAPIETKYPKFTDALSKETSPRKSFRIHAFTDKVLPISASQNSLDKYYNSNLREPMVFPEYKKIVPNISTDTTVSYEWLIANPKILAALSAKYIIIKDSPIVRIATDIYATNKVPEIKPVFELKKITTEKGKSNVKIITPVLYSMKNYILTFKAGSPEKSDESIVINAGDREMVVPPATIKPEPATFKFLINMPAQKDRLNTIPQTQKIVIKTPVELTEVKISELPPVKIETISGRVPVYKFAAEQIYDDNIYIMFENLCALPRARAALDIAAAKDHEEAARLLWEDDSLDISRTAIVENPSPELSKAKLGKLEITKSEYGCDSQKFEVSSEGAALFVLGDRFDDDWSAELDGRETNIFRVNGFSRGIFIPEAGKHVVTFAYKPKILTYGIIVSVISAFLILLLTALLFIRGRRMRKAEQENPKSAIKSAAPERK